MRPLVLLFVFSAVLPALAFAAETKPVLTEPDYVRGTPGEARVGFMHRARIIADKKLADHVDAIGSSLIRPSQRALRPSDPQKIGFHFYVTDSHSLRILPFADGTVLVPVGLLRRLDNEAQLAALLSASIAAIVQHQDAQAHTTRTKYRAVQVATVGTAVDPVAAVGGIGAGEITGMARGLYERSLLEQAAHDGLKYMVGAGYDFRQAPTAFKLSFHHHGGRPVAHYIEKQIATEYASTDFRNLKVGAKEYQQWRPPGR
jgi:predicted Zn-dependent protease